MGRREPMDPGAAVCLVYCVGMFVVIIVALVVDAITEILGGGS